MNVKLKIKLNMKYEFKITDEAGNVFLYDVSVPLPIESKGTWAFERSSGYAGYRCQKCETWIYESQTKKCDCDAGNER